MSSAYTTAKSKNVAYRKELTDLMVAGSQRTPWLAVLKAINECLPRDVTTEEVEQEDPTLMNRIRILSITAKRYDDLGEWYKGLGDDKKKWLRSQKDGMGKVDIRAKPDDKETAPSGAGFVFTLQGRHFHQDPNLIEMREVPYIENTLLKNLKEWEVPQLSVTAPTGTGVMVPVRKMGITHATIADSRPTRSVLYYKNGPAAAGAALAGGGPQAGGGDEGGMPPGMAYRGRGSKPGFKAKSNKAAKVDPGISDESQPIPLTDFVVEFVWKDVPEDKQEAVDPNPVKAAAPAGGALIGGQPAAGAPAGPNAAPMPGGRMPNAGMPNAGMPNAGMPNAGMPAAPAGLPGGPGANPQVPGGNLPGGGGAVNPGAGPAGPAGPAAGPRPN